MYKRHGNTLRMVKTVWITETTEAFSCKLGKKEHTYNVDLDKAKLDKKHNAILDYEVDVTNPIDYSNKRGVGKSSRLYDVALKSKAASDVLNEGREKTLLLVVGVFVVIIIGVMVYSQYTLGQANDKNIQLTKYLAQILANMTKTGGVIIR
jgi:hypothetical protein